MDCYCLIFKPILIKYILTKSFENLVIAKNCYWPNIYIIYIVLFWLRVNNKCYI